MAPFRIIASRYDVGVVAHANGVVKAANVSDGNLPAVSEVVLVASGTSAHVAWVLVVSSP